MAQVKTMTAPLAIVKAGGVPIGKMKNIRVTETLRRGKVLGLGALTPSELPALEWDGTMNCGFYLVNFNKEVIQGAWPREVQTINEFVDTVLLQEQGVQVDILRKVKDYTQTNGIIVPKYEIFATIAGAFATREGFDITESQISGRDMDFQYLQPILFPN